MTASYHLDALMVPGPPPSRPRNRLARYALKTLYAKQTMKRGHVCRLCATLDTTTLDMGKQLMTKCYGNSPRGDVNPFNFKQYMMKVDGFNKRFIRGQTKTERPCNRLCGADLAMPDSVGSPLMSPTDNEVI